MAEKYYSISPYAWCGNNPVKYVDPTGMWITIYVGMASYRYENGDVYEEVTTRNKNGGSDMKLVKFTPTSGSFLEGVQGALNKIYNGGNYGKDLINFFANDKNEAEIHSTTEENSIDLDKKSGNPIYLNDNLRGSTDMPTSDGLRNSDFWTDVAHELAHRQDFIVNPNIASSDWMMMTNGVVLKTTEKYATHIENLIRLENNLPLRTYYATEKIRLGFNMVTVPYYQSRIIDIINGKYVSKFYNFIYK